MERKEKEKEDPKKQMDEFRVKLFSERTKTKSQRKVNPELNNSSNGSNSNLEMDDSNKSTNYLRSILQSETNEDIIVSKTSQPDFTKINPPLIDVAEDGLLPLVDGQDLTICQSFNRMWLENMEFDRNEPLTEEQTYHSKFQPDLNPYEDLEIIHETVREYDDGDLKLDSTHPLDEMNEILEKKKNMKELSTRNDEEKEEMDDGNINKNITKSIFCPSMKRFITTEKARKKEKEFLEAQKERLDKRIKMKERKAKEIEDNQVKQPPPPSIINESKIFENKASDNNKVAHKVAQSKERTPSVKSKEISKEETVDRKKLVFNNINNNNKNEVNKNGDIKGFLYNKQIEKAVVPAYRAPQKSSNNKIIKLAINDICLPVNIAKERNVKVMDKMNSSSYNRYCILLDENKGYKSLYGMNETNDKGLKLHGSGPDIIDANMIQYYFKYNSVEKIFEKLDVSKFTFTVVAVILISSYYS